MFSRAVIKVSYTLVKTTN